MKKFHRGTVVLVDLGTVPYGHEQAGLRPSVLLSVQNNIALVVPLTSNTAALRFSATFPISPDKTNGLTETSVALAFQLRAIDTQRVVKRIGVLNIKDIRSLNKIISTITQIV
jgi:mRNA-degrading endonuclease toxin of MazEF toxin-antitoxin module